MQRQGQRDTKPELELRRALHALGLRFRVDRSPLPGMRSRADIVFGPAKVAVFVDGCFWHSCPQHGSLPANNRDWWVKKLAANAARDRRVDHQLLESDWLSIRVWEHEVSGVAARRIAKMIKRRRC